MNFVDPNGLNPGGIPGYEFWGTALPYVRDWVGTGAGGYIVGESLASGQLAGTLSPSAIVDLALGRTTSTAATAGESYLVNLGGRIRPGSRAGGFTSTQGLARGGILALIGVGVYTSVTNVRCQRAIKEFFPKGVAIENSDRPL